MVVVVVVGVFRRITIYVYTGYYIIIMVAAKQYFRKIPMCGCNNIQLRDDQTNQCVSFVVYVRYFDIENRKIFRQYRCIISPAAQCVSQWSFDPNVRRKRVATDLADRPPKRSDRRTINTEARY